MTNSIGTNLAILALIICFIILARPFLPMEVLEYFRKINRKWLTIILIVLSFELVFAVPERSILALIYWDGPYHGRVVDADTGDPIEGAAVAGYWEKQYGWFVGVTTGFGHATETITDSEGKFVLPRVWGVRYWPFSWVESPELFVFKSGYDSHPPKMFYAWTPEDEQKRGISKSEYETKFWTRCKREQDCLISLNKAVSIQEQKKAAGIGVNIHPKYYYKISNFLGQVNKELAKFGHDKWKISREEK